MGPPPWMVEWSKVTGRVSLALTPTLLITLILLLAFFLIYRSK